MFVKIGLSSLALLVLVNYADSGAVMDVANMLMTHSADFVKNGTECKAKAGATDEEIEMLMKRKIPRTKSGYCVIACMMEKLDLLNDGVFSHDGFVSKVKMVLGEEDPLGDLIGAVCEACSKKATTKMDNCEATKRMIECREEYLRKFIASAKAD